MPKKIGAIMLFVEDLGAGKQFYREVFGSRCTTRTPPRQGQAGSGAAERPYGSFVGVRTAVVDSGGYI